MEPIQEYQEFLQSKGVRVQESGIEIALDDINPTLYPFQRDIVKWACFKGRAAIFAGTGLGKTFMYLEWARLMGQTTLIVAPLSVAYQTIREAEKLGIKLIYTRNDLCVQPGMLYITNYERIDAFRPELFGTVVLDECFPGDTPIDCIDENGNIYQKHIENMEKGDTIINASGIDVVSDIHRREVKYAVRIKTNGKEIISSPNHPYFTQRGWIGAQDLEPGDELISTNAAMRMVQFGICNNQLLPTEKEILQSILFCEMADETTGTFSESSQSNSSCKEGGKTQQMVAIRQPQSEGGNRTHTKPESHEQSRNSRKSIPYIATNESQTFRAWGQWNWINDTTIEDAKGTRQQLAGGIQFITGETDSRLSNTLQDGLSKYRNESVHRSGWSLPQIEEGKGQEKRCEIEFTRVDSLEVLELGHSDLDRYRDENGKLYFYDIGATQHPSFSVNGYLVHNSSILKNLTGKRRNQLVNMFADTPYRLCATATPSPNDINEVGNHSEFLGHMKMSHMSSIFFVHEQNIQHTLKNRWRLKGYAHDDFYKWLASWAVAINYPSDLGYDDDGFILPDLNITHKMVDFDFTPEGMLPGFNTQSGISAMEANKIRRETIQERNELIAAMINGNSEQWLVWCGLNDEASDLQKLIPESVNVHGSLSPEEKAKAMLAFQDGEIKVLITKIKIAGMGMNLQNSHNMVFDGLNYSWEGYYQAIRRQWRHGQTQPVNVTIVTSTHEKQIYESVLHKERIATEMTDKLIAATKRYTLEELNRNYQEDWRYRSEDTQSHDWHMMLGDSAERMKELDDNSIDLTISSPPFSSLYIYSNTPRDLSNCMSMEEFFEHHDFIVRETLRITKPGRLACIHVQDIKTMKNQEGYRGLKDFSGMVIRAYQDAGWIYRATVTIWKNPQILASRNKDTDLLFATGKRDATALSPAPPDYLLLFRKPGDNQVPVLPYANNQMTEEDWILWAAPVWYDIKETDVLNVRHARSKADEKHMCPLQLDFIERCIKLYSNPGEMLFDPFAGIGSTGYEGLRWDRKFTGIELKPEYYNVACRNLKNAETLNGTDLFQWASQQQMEADNG
jgi:DNA modification methylase